MESYIKLLSIIAIVVVCTDALDIGIGSTIVRRDEEYTTIRPVRDFHSSTVGIKRDVENGTARISREESLNVTKRSVPHVHRQFLSTTVKSSIDETTRSSRYLNVTKRDAGFNHTVQARAEETTRSLRDVSTTHSVHVRAVETTRSSREVNVTKRDVGLNHTIHARSIETTRSSRDVNVTKRDAGFNHTVHVRALETTRSSRGANATKKAAHKKEKTTSAKPNKVKLSVDSVVTNFTNAKVRSIDEDPLIVKHDAAFNSTIQAIAITKRELYGGDLNVTKREIEATTRVKRDTPSRDEVLVLYSNTDNGGDDGSDDGDDE